MTTEDKLKEISSLGERIRCYAAVLRSASRGECERDIQDAFNQYKLLMHCASELTEAMKALPTLKDIIDEGVRNYKANNENGN